MSSHRVVVVTPSAGLGGGIERYATTMVHALESHDVNVVVHSLAAPGRPATMSRKCAFALRIWVSCLMASEDFHLVLAHPDLLPAALTARLAPRCRTVSVICHGTDIWQGSNMTARALLRLLRARVFGVSGFSAGAVLGWAPAGVLPPGLDPAWFNTLHDASVAWSGQYNAGQLSILTTFRLSQWESKGLPEIIEALQSLQSTTKVTLQIAGQGSPSPRMRALLRPLDWVTIHQDLTDRELARLYAEADLFVLATRLRTKPPASGEGFGLVLAEAQVAGTPVIAPARGGSWDAFWPGVTGLAPVGETAADLADAVRTLLDDPEVLKQMGESCRTWASENYDPVRHAALTYQALIPARPPQ